MENNNDKKVATTYGKMIKLPKNTNVVKFMENIKINKNKHWYLITEKETDEEGKEIHLVKYNQEGINAIQFVSQMKEQYIKNCNDEKIKKLLESIRVIGNDKFTVIKNIPNIEIVDTILENNKKVNINKTLVSKITSDLIKLLRND